MAVIKYESKQGQQRHSHPLDADLESIEALNEFADGSELQWGLAVTHAAPGWSDAEDVIVPGLDWQAEFYPPEGRDLPIPIADEKGVRIETQKIPSHLVLVRVNTGQTSLNAARDYGRPAVRAVLGMLQTRFPALTFQKVIGEGPIRLIDVAAHKSWFATAGKDISVEGVTRESISKRGLEFVAARARDFPNHLTLTLNWYSRSWFTDSTPERFVDLWLAVVVLVDHTYTKTQLKNTNQMDRVNGLRQGARAAFCQGHVPSESLEGQLQHTERSSAPRRNGEGHGRHG